MPETSGFAACAGYITKTILTDQSQFVLPCPGDRMFALTQDHEVAFAMPISKVETIMQGLGATHKAGQRYPVPSFLRFKAEFSPSYVEAMDYLKTWAMAVLDAEASVGKIKEEGLWYLMSGENKTNIR